nr:MAG TPA: hypothetical protein [Caudoviricetes sp.]
MFKRLFLLIIKFVKICSFAYFLSGLMLIFYSEAVFSRFFIVFAICIAKFSSQNRPHFCLRYD